MKELSIEEKAKRYDEAYKKVAVRFGSNVADEIFHKESKDEKIRKWLIRTLRALNTAGVDIEGAYEMMLPSIDWLEKQGEQNPTQEIEPTPIFRIGDVLKRKGKDYTFMVDRIQGGFYHSDRNHGAYFPIEQQDDWELVEQKTVIVPKFWVGDIIKLKDSDETFEVSKIEIFDIDEIYYHLTNGGCVGENVDNFERVEQKSVVTPKFKVGNWYQCTKDFFGKCVTFDKNIAYYCAKEGCLQDEYGCHIAIVKDLYDNFKLWTIQDAKDGDVLNSIRVQATIIFKGFADDGKHILAYCALQKGIFIKEEMLWDRDFELCPKNWNDELFSKMHEAGYEWDAEKKELRN